MTFLYYFLNIGITILGRMLDLLSTYYITPNLKLETNRVISRLGWKGSILLQVPLIIFGAFFRPIAVFFFAWSIIIASSNISGAWFIRNIPGGDEKYSELLKKSAKKTNLHHIILDESPPLMLFLVPNSIVWLYIHLYEGNILNLIIQDTFLSYVLIITGALMLHGIMSFIRNVLYINRLRKEEKNEDSGEDNYDTAR